MIFTIPGRTNNGGLQELDRTKELLEILYEPEKEKTTDLENKIDLNNQIIELQEKIIELQKKVIELESNSK
jgi:hypothetical protein